MTARRLQAAVIEDLEKLFSDRRYKTPDKTMEPIKIFPQYLPHQDAQAEANPFPYIQVRVMGGGIETPTSPCMVTVHLYIGIFDDGLGDFREPPPDWKNIADSEENPNPDRGWDTRNLGPMTLLEVIELIQKHYAEKPQLDNGDFCFVYPFYWESTDEEFFPYYTAACEMTFKLAAPRIERNNLT